MFLRCTTRKKNGKEHCYWSLVENKRMSDGRVAQRHVLYLGEINSSQELAWRKSIEVWEEGRPSLQTVTERWRDLFNAQFDVLLYDLPSTYFESDSPFPEGDKRKFGYSRDKRSDFWWARPRDG